MSRRITAILLLAGILSRGAVLEYTSGSTPSYGDDKIVYALVPDVPASVRDAVTFSDGGIPSDPEAFRRVTGFNEEWLRFLNVDPVLAGKDVKPLVAGQGHYAGMWRAFGLGYGTAGDMTAFRDRIYGTATFTPGTWTRGIVAVSAVSAYGSGTFWSPDGIYFGDVVNELSVNSQGPVRLFTGQTGNTNLVIMPLPNTETYAKAEKRGLVQGKAVAVPAPESMAYAMYGPEAQKLMRSEVILAKEYNCGLVQETGGEFGHNRVTQAESVDFRGGRGISYGTVREGHDRCSAAGRRDGLTVYPFLMRGNTLTSNGQIYNGLEEGSGTSYVTPRIAGVAVRLLEKFPGITYHQIKQILLTTAYRETDRLDNLFGWGLLDREKALKGPSALNPGLIEEGKFFTGGYDRVMGEDATVYFYADVQGLWKWENDIYEGLTAGPPADAYYDVAVNSGSTSSAMAVIEKVRMPGLIRSEHGFYMGTARYRGGLRKAGKGVLEITGDLLYGGRTEVLEGRLVLKGTARGDIYVYRNAVLELHGSSYKRIVNLGGTVEVHGDTKIGEMVLRDDDGRSALLLPRSRNVRIGEIGASEERAKTSREILKGLAHTKVGKFVPLRGGAYGNVRINIYKAADIRRENFMPLAGSEADSEKVYKNLRKKYGVLAEAGPDVRHDIPGYSQGQFAVSTDDRDFIPAARTDFTGKPNAYHNRRESLSATGTATYAVTYREAFEQARRVHGENN